MVKIIAIDLQGLLNISDLTPLPHGDEQILNSSPKIGH
jgi:hypothetical protein